MEWEFNPPEKMKVARLRNNVRRSDMRKPENCASMPRPNSPIVGLSKTGKTSFWLIASARSKKPVTSCACRRRAAFRYGMEALAGTGLARHKSFVGQARTFVQQFEQAMLNLDRDDPKSLHIHMSHGLSRQKIDPDTLPVFTENLSATTLLQHAVVDVIGLFFFAILTYMLAYRSWLRASIV